MASLVSWVTSSINYYFSPPPKVPNGNDFPEFVVDIISNYLQNNEISQMDIIRLNQFLQQNYPEMFVVRNVFDYLINDQQNVDISELVHVVYGNNRDPFHQMITNLLQALVQKKQARSDKDFLTDLQNPHSLYSILFEILLFKENFPAIYKERKYAKELALLQRICCEYHIDYKSSSKDLLFIRPMACIQDFENKTTLVLGRGGLCGRHDSTSTVFLNHDPNSGADIIGDYYSQETWSHLPSNHFKQILFEGFTPSPSQNGLCEIRRSLRNGGTVLMPKSPIFVLLEEENALEDFLLKRCGFGSYKILSEPMIELVN